MNSGQLLAWTIWRTQKKNWGYVIIISFTSFFTSAFSREICIRGVTIFMPANPRALARVSGQELHDVAAAEYDCGLASGMCRLQRPEPSPPSRHENRSGKNSARIETKSVEVLRTKAFPVPESQKKSMNSQAQGKTYGNKCEWHVFSSLEKVRVQARRGFLGYGQWPAPRGWAEV